MKQERLACIYKNLEKAGLEQMIVSDPASIFYLTGRWIDPGERMLALYLNRNGKNKMFINELFTVPEDLGVEKVWFSDTDNSIVPLAEAMDSQKPCGVEKTLVAKFLLALQEIGAAASFVNASHCVDGARARKDEEERIFMRNASRINDAAMEEFKGLVREGMTEIELADQFLEIYKRLGADGFSFTPLVAFGANAAIGHHEPDHTTLKPGDCVLLDVGCKKDSYCADMTRTFFYQQVSDQAREVYELVKRANEAAEAMIHPGVRFCDIDKAARDVITAGGYGKEFTHRLGHSIGIEVHEAGDCSSTNTNQVEDGNLFSIEPGIYIEGVVGVRIEDLVLVTEDGCEVLNHASKELQVIG